jgi:hypothetical protein
MQALADFTKMAAHQLKMTDVLIVTNNNRLCDQNGNIKKVLLPNSAGEESSVLCDHNERYKRNFILAEKLRPCFRSLRFTGNGASHVATKKAIGDNVDSDVFKITTAEYRECLHHSGGTVLAMKLTSKEIGNQ